MDVESCRRNEVCAAVAGGAWYDCGAYDCQPVEQTCPRDGAGSAGRNRSKKGLLGLLGLLGLIPLAIAAVWFAWMICCNKNQQQAAPPAAFAPTMTTCDVEYVLAMTPRYASAIAPLTTRSCATTAMQPTLMFRAAVISKTTRQI
jgi:hypothetical protein